MKPTSTAFLKATIYLIGAVVLAICLFGLPAAIREDATGLYRPILLGLYVTAIPFYAALYQALRLLGYIDRNQAFSDLSVKALTNIKYCGITISALFALDLPVIYLAAEYDDAPGVIVLGLFIIFASAVVAVFAALLQKLLKSGLDIKSENDLTV